MMPNSGCGSERFHRARYYSPNFERFLSPPGDVFPAFRTKLSTISDLIDRSRYRFGALPCVPEKMGLSNEGTLREQ